MPKKREVQYSESITGWDELREAITRLRRKCLDMGCDPKDIGTIGTVALTYDGTDMHIEISVR